MPPPILGSAADVFLPTVDGPEVRESASKALDALGQFRAQIGVLADLLELKRPGTFGEAAAILNCGRALVIAPPLESANLGDPGWLQSAEAVKKGISVGRKIENTKATHPELLPHAWGYDVHSLRGPIATYGSKWWRFLLASYRGARRELAGLVSGEVPKTGPDQLKTVDAILLVRRLDADFAQLRGLLATLFGEGWDATSPNWNRFDEISDFLRDVHHQIVQRSLPGDVVQLLSSNLDLEAVGQAFRRPLRDSRARGASSARRLSEPFPQPLSAEPSASTPRSSFGIPTLAADPRHVTAPTYRPAAARWSSSAQ